MVVLDVMLAYVFDKNAFIYIVRSLVFNNIAGNETKQQFVDIILIVCLRKKYCKDIDFCLYTSDLIFDSSFVSK